MKHVYATVCIVGFLAGCSTNRPLERGATGSTGQIAVGSGSSVTVVDANFAQALCQTTVAKAELGKLALRKSQNPEVRKVGRTLASEHTDATRELCRLLSRKGIESSMELSLEVQTALEKLAALDGPEFDDAFKEQIVRSHETTIELLERHRSYGVDADLKRFAERTLPYVCEQLTVARALTIAKAQHTSVSGVNASTQ